MAGSEHGPEALADPNVRDWAVRDWAVRDWAVRDWAVRDWAVRDWAVRDWAVRDWAVRDWRHVKRARRWASASVNQALAAIDNFYRSLAAGRPEVLPVKQFLSQTLPLRGRGRRG